MKRKILFSILALMLFIQGIPVVLGYTFKGTIGEMEMAAAEPWSRTFYSNYSSRYYMVFDDYIDVEVGYKVLYAHSPYGYTFDSAHVLLNLTKGGMGDYVPSQKKMDFYLEPNGRYLNVIWFQGSGQSSEVYYAKFEINSSTGQLYLVTDVHQHVLEGDAPLPNLKYVIDEISVVTDSEGYVFFGAEMESGHYWVFECEFNNGTWNYEDFVNVFSMDSEWIDNGHANPPNNAQGGQLLPLTGDQIMLVWWWQNIGPNLEVFTSMRYDRSSGNWVDTVGRPFYESSEGGWAFGAWSVADNVEAGRHAFIKQEEEEPEGQISVWAQTFNISTYTWSSKFQVGFNEAGDEGSIVFSPFASIHENGAVNWYWYKAGNETYWMNRMFPNGTLEGIQVVEDAEFDLESNQFSVIPNMNGDDKPSGIMYMDNIGGALTEDWLYYNTEILYLESDFVLPATHLNTTLYDPNGIPIGQEGFEDWIFEGEVYTLETYAENATSFFLNTADSRHEIIFNWDNSTSEMWISVDPADQFTIGLIHSEYERTGNITRLLWRFVPDRSIVDSLENAWTYTIVNSDIGFSLTADLGITTNFYNLGGFTEYTFTGDGYRTQGGHPFEIYATNGTAGSSARAEQIYRKLQSVHFLIELDLSNEWDGPAGAFDIENAGQFDIGIDYRINATWVQGWFVRISIRSSNVGHHEAGNDHNWIEWNVDWYNYNATLGTWELRREGTVVTNHWGYDNENLDPDYHNRTTAQLWVDLWFDRTNSSTTVAGQVNAMYHGMKEHGSAWWFGYGTFSPMISEFGNSQYLDDLNIQGFNDSSSMDLDLIRVWVSVDKDVFVEDADDEPWGIRAIENYNRKEAEDRMQGIEQPAFEETLVLDMPMFQSLNPLVRAVDGISRSIWMGALGFIKILWGAMDTIFEWAGFGAGFFSVLSRFVIETIPNLIIVIMENLTVLAFSFADIIISIFDLLVVVVPTYVIALGWLTGSLIDYWRAFNDIFTGGIVDFSIIEDLALGTWISAGITMLPFYEIWTIIWSKNVSGKLKERFEFYSAIFGGLLSFLRGMVSFMSNMVQAIRSFLPI